MPNKYDIYSLFTGNSIERGDESKARYSLRIVLSFIAGLANIVFIISIITFFNSLSGFENSQKPAAYAFVIGLAITFCTALLRRYSGHDSIFYQWIMPVCLALIVSVNIYAFSILIPEIYYNGESFFRTTYSTGYHNIGQYIDYNLYFTGKPIALVGFIFNIWITAQTLRFFSYTEENNEIWATLPIICLIIYVVYYILSGNSDAIILKSMYDVFERPINYILILMMFGQFIFIMQIIIFPKANNSQNDEPSNKVD